MIGKLAFAAMLVVSSETYAASDVVTAPIRAFVDAINKGDMKAVSSVYTAAPTIIDEFTPHHWSGPDALANWAADFGKDAAKHGDRDPKLTIVKFGRVVLDADHAYAVVPTDFTFTRKGTPMMEHGTITYALDHTANGWRIAGWAYSW